MMVEERLAALEQRLRLVEDGLAIGRPVGSFCPPAGAGGAAAVPAAASGLWAEHGEYDVEGWHMRSRADVAEMVRSPAHQGLISRGAAHFLGPVSVAIDGDDATAVCESIVIRRNDDGGGYRVWRGGRAPDPPRRGAAARGRGPTR